MKPFALQSEKEVYRCPFFSILERVYELPDGSENTYYVRHEVDTCCVLAITKDQQILIEKEFRVGPAKTVYQLPAGRLEDFNDDPDKRIQKELLEESGYTGNFQKVAEIPTSPYSERIIHCYIATECRQISDAQPDDTEFISVELHSPIEAKAILMKGTSSSSSHGVLLWEWALQEGLISSGD